MSQKPLWLIVLFKNGNGPNLERVVTLHSNNIDNLFTLSLLQVHLANTTAINLTLKVVSWAVVCHFLRCCGVVLYWVCQIFSFTPLDIDRVDKILYYPSPHFYWA